MKCPYCGAELADGAKFCTQCGGSISAQETNSAPVEPEAKTEAKAKSSFDLVETLKKNSKKLIAGCAGLLAIVIVISVLSSVLKPDAFVMRDPDFMVRQIDDEYKVIAGNKITQTLDCESYSVRATSSDGTVQVVYLDQKESRDLCVLTKKTLKTIVSDFKGSGVRISANGEKVLFVEDNTLKMYTVSSEKTVDIYEAGKDESVGNYVISANGKYVAYDNDGLYLSKNGGSAEKISSKFDNPTAISDNGKQIYCYTKVDEDKEDQKINFSVVNQKGESQKLYESGTGTVIAYNADRSEILFKIFDENDDREYSSSSIGKLYISRNGKEKVQIETKVEGISVVMPDNAVRINSFAKTYLMINDKLRYMKSNYTLSDAVDGKKLDGAFVSEDGSTVICYKSKDSGLVDLFTLKYGKTSGLAAVVEKAKSARITDDGNEIFYTDDDDKLWYVKGTGKPKEIDVDAEIFGITHDGYLLYVKDDEKLMYTTGGKGKEVKNFGDVSEIQNEGQTGEMTWILKDDVYYVATSGVNFKEVK